MKIHYFKYLYLLFFSFIILMCFFSCFKLAILDRNNQETENGDVTGTINMNSTDKPKKKVNKRLWVNTTFTDHMVLQREQPVRIYGYGGTPGDTISIVFDGKTFYGEIGEDEWEVWLDSMPACCEGKELTVLYKNREIRFKDVVVGEVWLCSGQSNMGVSPSYILKKNPKVRDDFCEYNNWENIRFYDRIAVLKDEPQVESAINETWKVAHSFDDVINSTAAGMAFASNLSHMLGDNIPIGIIHCSVGGSPIEAWISNDGLENININYDDKELWSGQSALGYIKQWSSKCYNGMLYNLMGYTYKGMFWYQGCGNAFPPFVEFYRPLFELFKEELKSASGNRDIPILVMQLVQHNESTPWGSIRQAQWDLMEIDDVYTVCGIDLGEKTESVAEATQKDTLHPTDKWNVGKRVAGTALKEVYDLPAPNDGNPYGISPTIDKAFYADGIVRVTVTDNIKLTKSDGKIGGFEAYAGIHWISVDAEYIGNEFIIHTEKLYKKPTAIRYMYSNVIPDGIAYMYNEYGLPLAPAANINIE